MEQHAQPQEAKQPKRLRVHPVVAVIFILFFLGIGALIGSSQNSKQNSSNTTLAESGKSVQAAKTSTSQPTLPITDGLNINRDAVIKGLQKIDPSIDFKLSTPVKGQERYMAQAGQNGIELYGKADNLSEVANTTLLGNNASDHSGNASALVYIIGVASVVDWDSKNWVTTSLGEISNAWGNGQTSIKKSTVINGKKFQIDAQKSDAFDTISLTIYSANKSDPPTSEK